MVNSKPYTTQNTNCVLPLCNAAVATYGVNGSANTATFAYRIDNANAATICFDNCVSFTTLGESATAIASDFAAAITAKCGGVATATASGSTFSVIFTQTSPQHLWVGTGAGDPAGCANITPIANCDVYASGGCTFNPTITLISSGATTTPALGTWELIGLGTLIAGIGAFLLRRGLS
jgi:hypothetical protein